MDLLCRNCWLAGAPSWAQGSLHKGCGPAVRDTDKSIVLQPDLKALVTGDEEKGVGLMLLWE